MARSNSKRINSYLPQCWVKIKEIIDTIHIWVFAIDMTTPPKYTSKYSSDTRRFRPWINPYTHSYQLFNYKCSTKYFFFPMVIVNVHPFIAVNTKIKWYDVSDDSIGCGGYDLALLQLNSVWLRLVLELQTCHELFQIWQKFLKLSALPVFMQTKLSIIAAQYF